MKEDQIISLGREVFPADDPLGNAVKSLFGLSYLFPYQRLVIANILEAAAASGIRLRWPEPETAAADETIPEGDEDTDRFSSGKQIVILPTGAGKSLCFQLPAMLMEGPTLVIYPILSLMADQQRRLSENGFSPVILRGGQSREERDAIWEKLASGKSKFIIANPEVLLTAQVKAALEKIKVVHIVIDEAHCVSEWGESFRPSYLEINSIIKNVNPPLVTAFTATASAPVLEKIKKYIFGDMEAMQIVGSPDRANISYWARPCIDRDLAVRDYLLKNNRPAIVFCSSRKGTEKIARYLRNELGDMGMDWHGEIRFYHAGLSREEKAGVEKWFLNNSEAVLCATCAFGMGVDKSDIRTVIHRDCPPSVEAYLQEAGRAGRDGAQSKAILLWGPEDEGALCRAKTKEERSRIAALLNYARETGRCRRHELLAMLNYDSGGLVPERQCCDVCEKESMAEFREEASLKDFFHKNKRRYTAGEASLVLAESETVRISEAQARQVIFGLVKEGRLKKLKYFPWKNKITV
ncbi:MAG: RecQ family ATP-dependent DNA helicase [Treponema sp.]|nr:RecQ family ATP-dependent DNA helicase [Treponema sp.]